MSEQNIVGVHTKDLRSNYSEWITAWTSHLLGQSFGIKVPSTAMAVNTPLNVKSWQEALSDHPNRLLVECFLCRISQRFCIGFKQPANSLKSSKRNLSCALQHPETVEKYLTEEIAMGRVAGSFIQSLVPHAHASHFRVIPKNHQPDKWRLIVDLSQWQH